MLGRTLSARQARPTALRVLDGRQRLARRPRPLEAAAATATTAAAAAAAAATAATAAAAPVLRALGALRTGANGGRLRLACSRGRPETATAAAAPLPRALRPLLGALRVAQPPPALLLRLGRDMHHGATQRAELW